MHLNNSYAGLVSNFLYELGELHDLSRLIITDSYFMIAQ